jgi:hypothetical protein
VFESPATLAARRKNSQGFPAERVNDISGIDPPAAWRVFAGKDIRAVVKSESIDEDRPVNCRIHGQGNDQLPMVAQGLRAG